MPLGFSEPLFRFKLFLALDSAVAANVQQPDSAEQGRPADEQAAVAIGRVFLAAEDREAGSPGLGKQLFERLPESGQLRHSVVEDVSVVVEASRGVDAPSQAVPEIKIFDRPLAQRRPKLFPIELGGIARVGTRPDVGQGFDPLPGQQVEEDFQGVIGVPDRPEREGRARWRGGHIPCAARNDPRFRRRNVAIQSA